MIQNLTRFINFGSISDFFQNKFCVRIVLYKTIQVRQFWRFYGVKWVKKIFFGCNVFFNFWFFRKKLFYNVTRFKSFNALSAFKVFSGYILKRSSVCLLMVFCIVLGLLMCVIAILFALPIDNYRSLRGSMNR